MRIATKFNLVAIALVFTALLAVSSAAFFSASNSLKLARLEHLKSIAELKAEKIQLFILERKNDIQAVQGYLNIKTILPTLSHYQQDRSHPIYIRAKKSMDYQLSVFQETFHFLNFMLLNRAGKLVYTSNTAHVEKKLDRLLPDPGNKTFEEGKKGIYVSKIFKEDADGFKFFISAPVYDFQEVFLGIVVFGINISSNFHFIQETTGLGKTGETLIGLESGGELIFLNPLRHTLNTDSNQIQTDGDRENIAYPMRQAVQGKEGDGVSIDYHGQEVLAVWKFISELNMGLVAKIDIEETYSPVTQLGQIILLIAIIVLSATLVLSSWLSRTLSKPIIRLSDFSQKVASGDLKHRIMIDSKDEIGQLSSDYNDMTQALADAQETELAKTLKHSETQKNHLKRQTEALKQTNIELEQFTYVVSHDLKAPFRAIHNYADFLRRDLEGKLGEEQEMYLSGLEEAVRDGEIFLNDLLSLSRLGKNQGKFRKTPLQNFLNGLIASLNFPHEVEFVVKEDGAAIRLEPTLARQIFQNLISNGVKFNKSSKKQIKIAWQLVNETYYEIYVKDNGIGIDPRFFERIFLPFQRLHPGEIFGGTGIGLATVKKAAALMQWSIRVESGIGQGSVFFIKVPVDNEVDQ